MSYRVIALLVGPEANDLSLSHFYSTTLQNGGLQLTEFRTNGGSPGSPLTTLNDDAMRCEWEKRFERYDAQLKDQGWDEKIRCKLRENGLWMMKDQFHKLDTLSLYRDLANEASNILNRRTIFLVPDYCPDLANEEKAHLDDVVKSIAEELKNKLANLDTSLNFGFLKHRAHQSPQTNTDEPGLMQRIIEQLFIQTSEQFSEQKSRQYRKEGPLLMDGPTGTGKSMRAQLIATEQNKKILKINIAAITDSLIESRMRGYKKGSFTGATKDHEGWFAKAKDGILFLDEFQNASLESQAQLLDLLDPVSNDVYVSRIGEDSKLQRFNVKVILAVNKPVDELLANGKLREDLFYRIRNVIKFESLDAKLDTLNEENKLEDKFCFIRMLIYLYRWKSAPILDLQNSESAWVSLFPEIDASIIPALQEISWKGNYRQFERFITDIHWNNDINNEYLINGDIVKKQIVEEKKLFGKGVPMQEKDGLDKGERERLNEVERLLQKNNFNIANTINDLKKNPFGHGLSSRQSLRHFLNRRFDQLKPEVRFDSRIVSFLQGRTQAKR